MQEEILKNLKTYFESQDEVVLAFLFGSRAEGRARESSDWDIGVYFRPTKHLELETKYNYQGEDDIRRDIPALVGTEVDIVVLNRARPSLVFDVLNSGVEIVNKDEILYLKLLSKTHYEAIDYWQFVKNLHE